jgi:phosphoribosylaminoimidazole-succinocarboxamide synthase
VRGRSMLVRKLRPLPVEAVVRGYLAGSGWKEYEATGSVCGVMLPPGLEMASRLPAPIFTPATKAAMGDHDENIDFARMSDIVGPDLAGKVRRPPSGSTPRRPSSRCRRGSSSPTPSSSSASTRPAR